MSVERDPKAYFNGLQQLANEQDRAKLTTLAVEFGSVLQRLPKLRAEMDAFLAPDQVLDYVGLVQRLEPQLAAAAEFLDEVDFLPAAMHQHEQVQTFIQRAEASLTFRTVSGAKQRLQTVCTQVREREETERKAQEAAARKAAREAAKKAKEAAERKAVEEAERKAKEAAAQRNHWSGQMGHDQYGRYGDLLLQGVKQRFRLIPAGSFMMGSPESEPERSDDEKQHRVTLNDDFWMADTACTQALWEAVMGDNPSEFANTPQNPVECVSWDDVQHFLQRANDYIPDMVVRLPSEAEWEYACRAGTTSAFSFGNAITPTQANYNGNKVYAGGGSKGTYHQQTVVVKSFSPNAWGLYQMHGNVWEWCQDYWEDYAYTPTDGSAAVSGNAGRRVLRGGSWLSSPRWLRSAFRGFNTPGYRSYYFGFRLVCGLPFAER